MQLSEKVVIGQRKNLRRVIGSRGPHDTKAPVVQRQQGQRPRRCETLIGRSILRAIGTDVRDDRDLIVVLNFRLDTRRGANAGVSTVSGNNETRRDLFPRARFESHR